MVQNFLHKIKIKIVIAFQEFKTLKKQPVDINNLNI